MTEQTADFDILDWIESGTVARRKVDIYNDAALAEEADELQRQLDALGDDEDDPEGSVGEVSERTRIEQAMRDVYERWQASKATWTVRALSDAEIEEISGQVPLNPQPERPSRPAPLPRTATKAEREAHDREVAAYEETVGEFERGPLAEWVKHAEHVQEERALHYISTAVVSVDTARGSTGAVSVEALRKMRQAPHGKARIGKLYNAVLALTTGDTEIPVPKSLTSSENDRG